MSTVPPPFSPPMPPKQNNQTALILLIVVGAVFLLCVGGGAFLFIAGKPAVQAAMSSAMKPAGCAVSVEAVQRAVREYALKHGGKLPDAATWQDQVKEYLQIDKDVAELKGTPLEMNPITKDGEWNCTSEKHVTGIAFNSDLSGKNLSEISDPRTTILVFETEKPAHSAHEPYKEKPESSSPTVFGQPRGWFVAPVEGEVQLGQGKTFKFKTEGS